MWVIKCELIPVNGKLNDTPTSEAILVRNGIMEGAGWCQYFVPSKYKVIHFNSLSHNKHFEVHFEGPLKYRTPQRK